MISASQTDNFICNSSDLKSGETGIKFHLSANGRQLPAFAIRYQGEVYAYLNCCIHLMLELDWGDGEYFDTSGDYIICANHGALFEPKTGRCIDGPCYGSELIKIIIIEFNSHVLLDDDRYKLCNSLG